MGTKNNPGKFDCYDNAEPDEPMFVLLARDRIGGALVRMWAQSREALGESGEKIDEAYACAEAMDAWARSKGKQPLTMVQVAIAIQRKTLAGILQQQATGHFDQQQASERFDAFMASLTTPPESQDSPPPKPTIVDGNTLVPQFDPDRDRDRRDDFDDIDG